MKLLLTILFCTLQFALYAQQRDALYKTVWKYDSLMFQETFNKCNLEILDTLVADDLEFYHDQGGITNGKKDFIESIRNNICGQNYKPKRRLVESTMQVFPLYQNGKLYAALQTGAHSFYAVANDKPDAITSTALFTHLWMLKSNGAFVLKRVFSYQHVAAKE